MSLNYVAFKSCKTPEVKLNSCVCNVPLKLLGFVWLFGSIGRSLINTQLPQCTCHLCSMQCISSYLILTAGNKDFCFTDKQMFI